MGKKDKIAPVASPFLVDSENGTIVKVADGSRIVVLGSVGWASLQQELVSTFVTGAGVILHRMGYSYGRHLGKVAKSRGDTGEDVYDSLLKFSKEGGWGRLSLNSGDLSLGQATIVMKECYFCLHIRESSTPICYMFAGLVAGITDEVTGKTHRVLEQRCIAKGDTLCEISVERLA